MEIKKLQDKTRDLASDNIDALKQAFPEIVTDGKVNHEKLKELLGEEVEEGDEGYSFTWPGKRNAIQLAISRNTGTLRPDKESSKDWDTTKNLFIEGDNLEVLRVLQNTYRGVVKMIYIDPPYNTGKDFVYKDDFKDNVANYKEQAGLVGQSNPDTGGRFHTNWLNMMYPRLRLAKNLLTDDGVIFISIDDHEVHNLRKICDEIFGADNFLAQLIWNKQHSQQQGIFKQYHEYVLVYSRTRISENIDGGEGEIIAGAIKRISRANPESEFTFPAGTKVDSEADFELSGTFGDSEKVRVTSGRFIARSGVLAEEVTLSAGWTQKDQMKSFFAGLDTVDTKGQRVVEFFFNSEGKLKCKKSRSKITPPTILPLFGMVSEQTEKLKDMMGGHYFENPKPVQMLSLFLSWFSSENDIILDFFSGSGTTAQAVMELNAEDKGNRRFIMVQLPEKTSEESEAYKAGFKTIAEIGRERVRRAGEKVKTDFAEKLLERGTSLDTGFKAFTFDSTNLSEWDSNTEDINASLLAALDTFKEGRDAGDALYEVLLKYGVDITESVEVLSLAGKTVYSLTGNHLLVCLEKKITLETAEEMAKLKPTRVVCYDDGFESDEVKQNALETLKRAGVSDVRVI